MKFSLLNCEIDISDGRKNYMQILDHFRGMAEQAEREFRQEYENNLGTVFFNSTYAERFEKTYGKAGYMDEIVKKYVTKTRLYLENYGVTSLAESTIWKEAILSEDRTVSRLQYEFNVFEDSILFADDDIDDKTFIAKMKQKFNNNAFEVCLHNDVMALCDFALRFLDEKRFVPVQFVYKNESSKAASIYDDLVSSSVPADDHEKMVCALIELDPRIISYYEYIFCKYPQAKFDIVAIAKYLSVDLSKLIEQDIFNTFDVKRIACEGDALKMKSDLQTYLQRMGLTRHPLGDNLEIILHDYDIAARTYDATVYETRELRSKAEADDKYLCELCGDLESLTKEQCLMLISSIEAEPLVQNIKEKRVNMLEKRISIIQQADLEDLLVGLDGMCESECSLLIKAIEEYDAPNDLKNPFKKRVEARVLAIWDIEDFARFSELYKQTPVGDSAAVGQTCSLIQREGRTETKELFVKALYLLNENEVVSAAKYALAKESGMFASLLNMGKKESYMILTLNGRLIHPAIEDAMKAQKEAKGTGLLGGLGKLKNSFGFGKAISSPNKACPNCGKTVTQDVNFCPYCGNKID